MATSQKSDARLSFRLCTQETCLSDKDRDLFLALLDADGEPNEALKQAAEEHQAGHVEVLRYHWTSGRAL